MPVGHSPVPSRKKPTIPPGPADRPGQQDRTERRPSNASQSSRDAKANNKGKENKREVAAVDVGDGEAGADVNIVAEGHKGMDEPVSKTIGKLDESAYKLFGQGPSSVGSVSRSSSDTGSEGAICNGGPGKNNCGNPVKDGEAGVLCDRCHEWFHAACQEIPKAAIKALDKFECLAWLCANCKLDMKNKKSNPKPDPSLEIRIGQLEQAVQRQIDLMSSSIQMQEKVMKDQSSKIEQSMLVCEKYAREQAKAVEQTIHQQRASYADTVKGTCSEVAKVVKSQLDQLPKAHTSRDNKAARELSQALDDHLDKERRKANLVIHNLPEQGGSTLMERSEKDIALFSTMIKDVMKLHATSSKSFRVGKKQQERPRLLIITLDNPACKHDILRGAPQLRNSGKYDKIYITPDLTLKEREAGRKLREELASRKRAGEENLAIRGGKIIHTTGQERAGGAHMSQDMVSRAHAAQGGERQANSAPAVLGSGGGAHQSASSQGGERQANSAPAVLGSGGGAHQSASSQGGERQANSAPAVLGSGGGAHQSFTGWRATGQQCPCRPR